MLDDAQLVSPEKCYDGRFAQPSRIELNSPANGFPVDGWHGSMDNTNVVKAKWNRLEILLRFSSTLV